MLLVASTSNMRRGQVGDILRVLDAKKVWSLRNKYATLRPTGWRSDPGIVVPAKCALFCKTSKSVGHLTTAAWTPPFPYSFV